MMRSQVPVISAACFVAGSLLTWIVSLSVPFDREAAVAMALSESQIREVQEWNHNKTVAAFAMYNIRSNSVQYLFSGALENADLLHQFFPGTIARIYASNIPVEELKPLMEKPNIEIWTCQATLSTPGRMREYRFLAYDDPKVQVLLCRDLDSHVALREMLAVNEWLASDLLLHSMHDHPQHNAPVLAGMWGAKRGAFGPKFSMEAYLSGQWSKWATSRNNTSCAHEDQDVLEKLWYNEAGRLVALTHTSERKLCYHSKECRNFPMSARTPDAFVGNAHKEPQPGGHYECTSTCKWESRVAQKNESEW
eukprot:m51a1_g9446 hypothetical protein (308) ;mRNA; f:483313-484521